MFLPYLHLGKQTNYQMAVEKGKVKAALDAKFKGKSVSRELKEAYAARWADKIETDEDIDSFIDDRADDVMDAAKEADRRATNAAQNAKKEAADAINGAKKDETESADPNATPEGMPDWMKPFATQMQQLAQTVQGMQAEKVAATLEQRFMSHESLKGLPQSVLKRYIPKTEAELETAISEAAADLAPMLGQSTPQFGHDVPTAAGTPPTAKTKEASTADLDALMSHIPLPR